MERAANASAYHRYEWRRVITDVFGHETCYFAARDSHGEIRGVLPTVRLRSRLFGDFFVSMPYFNYGGVLADRDDAADALIEAAAGRAQELGVGHLELRHRANVKPAWPVRTDKVAMYLRLPGVRGRARQAARLEAAIADQAAAEGRRGGRPRRSRAARRVLRGVLPEHARSRHAGLFASAGSPPILDAFPDRTRVFVVRHARQARRGGHARR